MKGSKIKLNALIILLFLVAMFSGCTGSIKVIDYQLPTTDNININYEDLSKIGNAKGYSVNYNSYLLIENNGDQAITELVIYNDNVEKTRGHITLVKGENKIPIKNLVTLPITDGQKVSFKLLKDGKEVGGGESFIGGNIPPRIDLSVDNFELTEDGSRYTIFMKSEYDDKPLLNPIIDSRYSLYFDDFSLRESKITYLTEKTIGILEAWIPGEFKYEVKERGKYQDDQYNLISITEEGVDTLIENRAKITEEMTETSLFGKAYDIDAIPTATKLPYSIMEHSEITIFFNASADNAEPKKVFIVCEGSYSKPVCQVDRVEAP